MCRNKYVMNCKQGATDTFIKTRIEIVFTENLELVFSTFILKNREAQW